MKNVFQQIFTRDAINDSFFGDMCCDYDEALECYYLDKDVEIEGIDDMVILYIETKTKAAVLAQVELYKKIEKEFKIHQTVFLEYIFNNVFNGDIEKAEFYKTYRIESITLCETSVNENCWKLEYANTENLASRIVLSLNGFTPFEWSLEA